MRIRDVPAPITSKFSQLRIQDHRHAQRPPPYRVARLIHESLHRPRFSSHLPPSLARPSHLFSPLRSTPWGSQPSKSTIKCPSDRHPFLSNPLLTAFFLVSLEDAVNNALKNYFPRLEPTSNVRVQFYNKFQGEADDHDKEFLVKYNGALDTTLIFVRLFSSLIYFCSGP